MQVCERPQLTIEQYAHAVRMGRGGTFQSKATRDAVHKLTGGRKSSIRNQNLHPEYVTDYVGKLEVGFGNTQYRMHWSALYEITL